MSGKYMERLTPSAKKYQKKSTINLRYKDYEPFSCIHFLHRKDISSPQKSYFEIKNKINK